MSVPASERLITLAVYNPDLLNKEDLIRGFVARKTLLDRLLDDLRRETRDDTPPQPYLILGQRGLGKTTLLRRLAYAIEDDPDLGAAWMPLVFPEEQYNVATLSDFWLNCVDALGDAIERGGNPAAYRALDARVEGMPRAEPERRRQALELLLAEADRLGKRLMLLIDNIDIVFDRLGEEQDGTDRCRVRRNLKCELAAALPRGRDQIGHPGGLRRRGPGALGLSRYRNGASSPGRDERLGDRVE